jgi:hypothetical protein
MRFMMLMILKGYDKAVPGCRSEQAAQDDE